MAGMKQYYHDELMENEEPDLSYFEYDIIEPALTNEPSNFDEKRFQELLNKI